MECLVKESLISCHTHGVLGWRITDLLSHTWSAWLENQSWTSQPLSLSSQEMVLTHDGSVIATSVISERGGGGGGGGGSVIPQREVTPKSVIWFISMELKITDTIIFHPISHPVHVCLKVARTWPWVILLCQATCARGVMSKAVHVAKYQIHPEQDYMWQSIRYILSKTTCGKVPNTSWARLHVAKYQIHPEQDYMWQSTKYILSKTTCGKVSNTSWAKLYMWQSIKYILSKAVHVAKYQIHPEQSCTCGKVSNTSWAKLYMWQSIKYILSKAVHVAKYQIHPEQDYMWQSIK